MRRRIRRIILPERVFGRPGAPLYKIGRGDRPYFLSHPPDQFTAKFIRGLGIGVKRHVGIDALALYLVRIADYGGLGHASVRDESAFHLGRAHPVTRHVYDVVDAPGDPVVTVFVAAAAVAGKVLARIGREVSLDETVVISVNGARLPRP